ncbi:hypothetical protein J2Z21_004428 [Streptomyces griseochromogenes]|uniref:Uncharacterized protein n=1 Tax=Streptomyces griseochromogenes TaxID=68214 RepID=A0A1B1AVW6_9ACTN|nr:hypothetical protein [Streptomyces griseochromogenes]ANP50670.1 hypothetical protein AVL59_14490 [Streptomyces griseochromogenes]MBP2051457.1 hypothetical protein [Streptomyces griseochromogenes]
MGITTAWSISAHDDGYLGNELAPRFLPLIEAERNEPLARERWARWTTGDTWPGEPSEDFLELVRGGDHVQKMYDGLSADDPFSVLHDVWDQEGIGDRLFISVQSKDWAVWSFFHAIGPARAALLPGWCGNFLLTSAEVRDTLPRLERALTFDPAERAAARRRDWLGYSPEEESVLDGPLRMWRLAAQAGMGLCGVSLTIY